MDGHGPDSAYGAYSMEDGLSKFVDDCVTGRLADAMRDVIGITADSVRRRRVFRRVCNAGQLDVARWLAERFDLSREDILSDDGGALGQACQNGHLETATWLADRFGLTSADARSGKNFPLLTACANGHLVTAQWLYERFGLGPDDAREGGVHAFQWACRGGYLEVARWLVDRAGLTVADARAGNDFALRGACHRGNLAVATWLLDWFELSPEDRAEFILNMVRQGVAPLPEMRELFSSWQVPPGPGDKPAQHEFS